MSAREIPTLKSQYAEKVTADLDLNTAEQERIREEIASLQERLAGLEQDHVLLVGMRAALGDVAAAVSVPAPRAGKKAVTATAVKQASVKQASVKQASVKQAPVKQAPVKQAAAKNAPAKKAAAKKASGRKSTAVKAAAKEPVKATAVTSEEKAASKEKQVPLTELIHRHLSGQAEPKTAREIAQVLKVAHPDRSVSDNLVRTTTERLVARSLAERVKQGATVYYTALPHHGGAVEAPVAAAGEAAAEKETENTPAPATA
ncbi:hypothetical protein [Streptomyces sp. NBC_00211]|uniref:hypothetical protein n=1 Tax=Streptomyces sp. NBC_00211 TaxID=2975683 RepID=UPI00324DC680